MKGLLARFGDPATARRLTNALQRTLGLERSPDKRPHPKPTLRGPNSGAIGFALVRCDRTTSGAAAMTKKRMVLEMGMGTDIRGADPTKAACRALRDALWHNSLSIAPALGHPLDAMIVDIHIGVPRPELVDKAEVMAVLPADH